MKKIAIRICLSIFVLWFFSLWLTIVYGEDYSSSDMCSSIPNYSNNSNSGTSYATNNNIYAWYINSPSAISLATTHPWSPNVCSDIELATSRVERKQQLCTNNLDELKTYQETLLWKYKIHRSYQFERWFDSAKKVWGLQNLMKEADCQDHRDCKLWVVTIWDFLFCNICSAIDPDRKEPTSISPQVSCPVSYEPILDNLCCEKVEAGLECQIKKNWGQCTNSGTFWLEVWATDLSKLNEYTCEQSLEEESLPFCAWCDKIPESSKSCEESYWEWWYDDNDGCCVNCGQNKQRSANENSCTCTLSEDDCINKWKKLNSNTCKCECDPSRECCGILLNTVVPFIGDCIEMTSQDDPWSSNAPNTTTINQLNAFPFLMMGLSKILVTIILIFSFLIIIVAWLMMTTWVYSESNYKKGMERIQKVVVWLILLWASGLILKLINPSFFG